MKRRQNVVLRDKVRQERRGRLKNSFLKTLRIAALSIGAFAVGAFLHRILFRSDVFMIKWIEIQPEGSGGSAASNLEKEISGLKGRSILTASFSRLEETVKNRHPEIRTLKIGRSFPGTVKVSYSLRAPLGVLKRDGSLHGIDEEGRIFPVSGDSFSGGERPPEIVASSTASLAPLVGFLKDWARSDFKNSSQTAGTTFSKIFIDETDEVSLVSAGGLRVIWGSPDPVQFQEKMDRFRDVWIDLKKRSVPVQTINLREVPQTGGSALGGTRVVGRVIVRPLAEKKPAASMAETN
jgi:cell division septal protein FtsQ